MPAPGTTSGVTARVNSNPLVTWLFRAGNTTTYRRGTKTPTIFAFSSALLETTFSIHVKMEKVDERRTPVGLLATTIIGATPPPVVCWWCLPASDVKAFATPVVRPEPTIHRLSNRWAGNVPSTPERRRTGPCMSRRRGQTGYVWQKHQNGNRTWDSTAPAYGQVWVDVPGKENRERKFYQLGVCRSKS
jgi:hypothetical protein